MGLLKCVLVVVLTMVVLSDGMASADSKISATESNALQNKIPPTRELAGMDPSEEERGRSGERGGRKRTSPCTDWQLRLSSGAREEVLQ